MGRLRSLKRPVFRFAGLIRQALKSGQVPVEKMIDNVESAAYEEICTIWEHLEGDRDSSESLPRDFKARRLKLHI